MENTQYNFSLSEQRLCDFFGKKARARRQARRCRRRGGAEQAQQNVSATEYVDQEEDTEVTVATLTEKRDAIQAKMDKAGEDFSNVEGIMTAKGYYEAAEELNKFYQEEYLTKVAEHEGELYEDYMPVRAKHKEAQENPIYQQQLVQQCGRCQYYRWIMIRRQKEIDEHERTLDGLLNKYDKVVDGLIGKLSRETDRVENEYYEEITVTVTNVITGEEKPVTAEIKEEVKEVKSTLNEIAEAEVEAENKGVEIKSGEEPVEDLAEKVASEKGIELARIIAKCTVDEVNHDFFEKLGENGVEAQEIMKVGIEAGKDDAQITEEIIEKYGAELTDNEKKIIIKVIQKAKELKERIERDYSPKMEKFKENVIKFRNKWEIYRAKVSGTKKEHADAMVKIRNEVWRNAPSKGSGPNGKISLQDVVDFKDWLSNKKQELRDENFALGRDFDKKSMREKRKIERLTETHHAKIKVLNIYIAQLTDGLREADYNALPKKRAEEARAERGGGTAS